MKLNQALGTDKFIVTSEVQPPLFDAQPEDLVEDFKRIHGGVDGVAVADFELEGILGDSIQTCELLEQNCLNAIYQTTCRDKNRVQLQKDLVSAHQAGVENLLVFTEDYRISGDSVQEAMFFHVDSGKLASVLEHMRDGRWVDGEALAGTMDFTLGSGVEAQWGRNIPKKGMQEMEAMRQMGVGFFLTTPIFDLDQFRKFIGQVNALDVPVIAEVLLLRNPAMARFINRHFRSGMVPEWVVEKLEKATHKKQAGIELFADLVKGLKELCRGVHIITMGGENRLQPYLDAAGLR